MATLGEQVLLENLLDVDQGALARAIVPVLESGKRYRIKRFAGHRASPPMALATSLR